MKDPFITYKITVFMSSYSFSCYNDDLLCLLYCVNTLADDCTWNIYICDRIEGLNYEKKLIARSAYVV